VRAHPREEAREPTTDCKRVSHLYGIRSTIVHTGVQDVQAEDLGVARLFARRAILEVLHSRRIRKDTDLDDWFNVQVLK
jgi:hypothetical protein